MDLKKIVDYGLIFFALVIAILFFFWFDLEDILWNREVRETVSLSQIKDGSKRDCIGKKAGEGIIRLKTKDEWEDVLNDVDYVTVVPKSVIKTNVYSLAKWEDHYTRRSNGTTGRKRADIRTSSLDIFAEYTPYYIVELEDGTHILAQMNRGIAKRIQKGEEVELPLGRKQGFLTSAKKALKPICDKYDVDTKYVLYTIDDEWEKGKSDRIFIEKVVIAFVLFIVLAVVLQLAVDKLAFPDDKE